MARYAATGKAKVIGRRIEIDATAITRIRFRRV
jgi:hypothetical protein